ncbi:MAG: tetratricopeptide repeat protein [Halioglobus sp.]
MKSLALVLLLLCSLSLQAATEVTTESAAMVYSEGLLDSGEFVKAIEFLERAVVSFPENDSLLVLYGQALYESHDLDAAEEIFRQALQVNPLNSVAEQYIQQIRETSDAIISPTLRLMVEVAWDKAGDVVILAIGFFLGSLLSGSLRSYRERRFFANSKKLFTVGHYEVFADMLETQLSENNFKPLRQSLAFMLEHKTMDESTQILSKHVNSEDNLKTLVRMIKNSESNAK